MIVCDKWTHELGSSRLEYMACKEGHNWWRCLECGKVIIDYTDVGCGE